MGCRAFTTLAMAAVLVAGCGGDSSGLTAAGKPPPLPGCAGQARPIARPAKLPAGFPLPPGTVLRSQRAPFSGQLIVEGVVPFALDPVGDFFDNELPESGYALGAADSEAGEREAIFTGHGVRGGFRVNEIKGCSGAVTLSLVLIEQP